ncbi:uncharacterized protein LOC144230670 [Crocuta crocuta]
MTLTLLMHSEAVVQEIGSGRAGAGLPPGDGEHPHVLERRGATRRRPVAATRGDASERWKEPGPALPEVCCGRLCGFLNQPRPAWDTDPSCLPGETRPRCERAPGHTRVPRLHRCSHSGPGVVTLDQREAGVHRGVCGAPTGNWRVTNGCSESRPCPCGTGPSALPQAPSGARGRHRRRPPPWAVARPGHGASWLPSAQPAGHRVHGGRVGRGKRTVLCKF